MQGKFCHCVGIGSSMSDEPECPVCLEHYDLETREPKVLPCSGAHELCQACALQLRATGSVGGQPFHCPVCRELIPAGMRINTNRGLVASLEMRASQQRAAAVEAKRQAQLSAELAAARQEIGQARAAAADARAAAADARAAHEPDRTAELKRRPSKHNKPRGGRNRTAKQPTDVLGNEVAAVRSQLKSLYMGVAVLVLLCSLMAYQLGSWATAHNPVRKSEPKGSRNSLLEQSMADLRRDVGMTPDEFEKLSKFRKASAEGGLDIEKIREAWYQELKEDKWKEFAAPHPNRIDELTRALREERDETIRDAHGDGVQTELVAGLGGDADYSSDVGGAMFQVWPDGDFSRLLAEPAHLPVIHRLCFEGHVEKLRNLLSAAGNSQAKMRLLENRIGLLRWTPLMLATAAPMLVDSPADAAQYISIVDLLLKEGARPDAKDLAGFTALHLAAGDFATPASQRMIEMLVRRDADINIQNRYGETPLLRAFLRLMLNWAQVSGLEFDGQSVPSQTLAKRSHQRSMHAEMLFHFCEMIIVQGADLDIPSTMSLSVRSIIEAPDNVNVELMRPLLEAAIQRDNVIANGLVRRVEKGGTLRHVAR